MPNTQVPPEVGEGTLSAYYSEVSTHEWYQQLTPEQQFGLDSLRISKPLWGVCECGRGSKLYAYTYKIVQRDVVGETRCLRCTRNRVITGLSIWYDYWHTNHTHLTGGEIEEIIMPERYFPPATDERHACGNCDQLIYEPNDINVMLRNTHWVEATNHVGETVRAHSRCTFECACGTTFLTRGSNSSWVDRTLTCEGCVEELINAEEITQCEHCSNYTTDIHWSDQRNVELCESCFNDSWECNECGYEITEGYDHECYREENSIIYQYSYKPDPQFFGNDDYYFGLELEVEDAHEWGCENGAQIVVDELGGRVYCKSDGSLNDGFEIVTHPHSFQALKTLDLRVLDTLRRKGFRSWDTSTCGLHVHISRTAFRKNGKRDEAHELRFQKLIYDNGVHVRAIAGRSSSYARFNDKGKLVPKVKYGQTADRYEAINVQNDHTLEVRVFRGSLKPERVLSAVEFLHSAVEYTRNMKVNPKDNQLSWVRFMAYVLDNKEKYQNFAQIALKNLDNPRDTQMNEEDN